VPLPHLHHGNSKLSRSSQIDKQTIRSQNDDKISPESGEIVDHGGCDCVDLEKWPRFFSNMSRKLEGSAGSKSQNGKMNFNIYSIASFHSSAISLSNNTIVGGDLKVGCEVYGLANIHNGSPYAVNNYSMASGSLTTGGHLLIMELLQFGVQAQQVY
jgi:hypothetical protein